uniref:myosin heavy chain, skeletal muscle-like n=1 Tax=Semicossyphus pulcher TaxID=241346 RepID=UPI0037E8A553
MSQKTTTTPETEESLTPPGQGTLNLLSPSGEKKLSNDTQSPVSDTSYIRQLLEEFKDLYEQRLRCVDLDPSVTGEELLQKKVNFLQTYVNDLADQNQVLLQTIEDLQKEAGCTVPNVGTELRTSDRILDVSEVDLRTMLLEELAGPAAHIPHRPPSLRKDKDLKVQLQTKNTIISDLERERRESLQQKLAHLQSELSCLQRIQKDDTKEIAEKDICITKLRANVQLLQQEGSDAHAQLSKLSVRARELQEELKRKEEEWRQTEDELRRKYEEELQERKAHAQAVKTLAERTAILNTEMKDRDGHVRNLDQDVVALRATQDSLKRTLATKEKHANQLARDNAQLKESLASLQSKLQAGEFMLRDTSETLDQTETSLHAERQQKQQIQDQLHHANTEMERLQEELTHVRRATEKKMQKREIKMCTLVKELAESTRQHSECQKEEKTLLRRDKASQKLREERDELRAKMDDRSRECVHLNQTQERLEADLALSHEKLHTLHLEVRSRDQLILQLRAEMKSAEQKHQKTQEQVASLEGEVRNLKRKSRGQQEEACKLSEKVRDIERLKDQTEKDQQQLHDLLCASQQQMKRLHQQLKGAKEELKDAGLQKETVAIFKQKYTAAIEKVHRVQGRVELLEEELRYSQQQLKDSQLATHSMKDELAEMAQRYQEKVGQWENSQEALDQLTDELQANQNLLKESRQTVDHLKGLKGSLQEQVDTLKQQKLMLERDLRRYQQSHSHSDEDYLSLLKDRQQLRQCCTEQVERHAECEKAILQMKSELERQTQEKMSLKQCLVASHHTHMSNQSHLEQEVTRLKKEVTHLEVELADNQKVHAALLRQSEEELKEAGREAARMSIEVEAQRGESHTLKEELREKEEEMRRAFREKQSLSGRMGRLRQEMEELRNKHQVTAEELAARAEEARRMEGCLTEGKLAEEKIRSMAVKLELDVEELRRNLQQAVNQKLQAEREKQDAQGQVETLRLELEGTRSDNTNLRQESQLVMTNVNRWITEQKASNKSLTAQIKAQNKVLLIITEEKEHLQEANDTLNAEVKGLKEVANEKERDAERFKAQIRDQGIRRDENTMEKHGCVALNLYKIEDMQTRLRSNLEAIGMLNQQLNALSQENKRLRRQLEEERSVRRQADYQRSSIHLPLSLSARPLPPSTLPLSIRRPSSPELAHSDKGHSHLFRAERSRAGETR